MPGGRRREHAHVPQFADLPPVAGGDDRAARGASDDLSEGDEVTLAPLVDVEAHAGSLHQLDEAQELGVHPERGAYLDHAGADLLVRRADTGVEARPAREVGAGERAHRWPARPVEILRPGHHLHERRHLVQRGDLFRNDRDLVLGEDI